MNDEPTTPKVPPELDAAIDAVFAYGKPKHRTTGHKGRVPKAAVEGLCGVNNVIT